MKKNSILVMIPLLLSISTAQAEEAKPEVFALPDVIVTATKTDMDKKEVPASVEVITQDDIKARGAHSLKDIMRSAANISLIRSTGRDAISIRGFESRFSTILIDGRRISSEIDQNYELDRISLENVERIEIVRGPASSLYGTDALGGIVNIITKRSKDSSFVTQFDHGRYSSADTNQYQFSFDSGKRGQYGFVISGSQFENERSLKGNGTTYAPFGDRRNISLRLDYQPTDKETFTLTSSYMDEDTTEYTYKGVTKVNLRDNNERYEYSLNYEKRDADANLFLRAYLSEYYKKSYVHNLTSGAFMNYGESHRTLPGFEARLTQNAGTDHILTYGGEYRPEKFRGTGVRTGKDIYSVDYGGKTFAGSGIDIDYSAFYVQDEWQVSPKLLAITSLRYDDSNQFESNLSPKVGFTYKATPESRIKLNVSKGFRSPTPNQLYISSSSNRNGSYINLVGNPDLESEKSNSYELSFEQDWGKATGKLTYFTNRMNNLIDEQYVGVINNVKQYTYENISKATIQGVETELFYPLSDHFTWSATYSYLDAVNDATSTRLYNRPRHKIGTRFAYDSLDGIKANLWCEAYADYLFEVTAGTVKNTAYTLWNMNMERALSTNTTLILGVDNLLNKKDDDLSIQGAYIHTGLRMKF